MHRSLAEQLMARSSGISLYGLAPPKKATPPEELEAIVVQQVARLQSMRIDGLIVYDIQDEAARISEPRPFPFLPTIEPATYAHEHLERLPAPKIVYRCVHRDTPETFIHWLKEQHPSLCLLARPANELRRAFRCRTPMR